MTELTADKLPTQVLNLEDLSEVLQMYNEVTRRLEASHQKMQAEVARLTEQLAQKNRELEMKKRLAALGEMAAGIAHEIRNPLGGIQLYASTLASEVKDRPLALELTQKIAAGVRGLNALVSDMLTFTQNMHIARQREDLGDIVAAAADLAQPTLLQGNCDVRIDDGLFGLIIEADAKLLRQVVLNLILNSAEALREKPRAEGGMIRISASTDAAEADAPSPHVALVIEDNGPGIEPAVLEKIFNPFFTTKHTGTGLGLAIVHRIIEAHQGTIEARNRAEGGARFILRL